LIRETDQRATQVNVTRTAQDDVATYTDPCSLATTCTRNGFGEVKRRINPDIGTTDYVYDARVVVTSYTYDNAGRVLTKTFPAAVAENVTYAYDSVLAGNKGKGRLTSVTDQSGSMAYVYDVRAMC
jgi:YD repeat-containing protein